MLCFVCLLFTSTWVLLGIWWGLCYSSYKFSVLCFVCLTLPVYLGSPRYMVGSVLLILLVFCVVFCLFTLHVYLGSPRYLVGSVLLILLVFCVVFCLSYSSRVPGFS